MQIIRGDPPTVIERPIDIEFSREEVIQILTSHVKAKAGDRMRLDDIEVYGLPDGKLETIRLIGVEDIPINWKKPETKPAEK